MKARQQRMIFIGLVVAGVVVSAALALKAVGDNALSYRSPTEVAEGQAPADRSFRLGGLVVDGSVKRAPGSLTVNFVVTDYASSIPVEYSKILPDLFAEGQGVVAHGRLNAEGVFVADEVLAKHDENYMAPEVKESLEAGAKRAAQ